MLIKRLQGYDTRKKDVQLNMIILEQVKKEKYKNN